MNDSVLDILIFLFDNFMDVEDAPPPERAVLRQALDEAAVGRGSLTEALPGPGTGAAPQAAPDWFSAVLPAVGRTPDPPSARRPLPLRAG